MRDVADPRISGLISITHVDLSPDMRQCRVSVSVLSQTPAATVMQGLNSACASLQRTLAKNLATRGVPALSFALDESLKKQSQILQIIQSVQGEPPVGQSPAAADNKNGAQNKNRSIAKPKARAAPKVAPVVKAKPVVSETSQIKELK